MVDLFSNLALIALGCLYTFIRANKSVEMVTSINQYFVFGGLYGLKTSKTQRQDCITGTDLRKEKVYAPLSNNSLHQSEMEEAWNSLSHELNVLPS